MKQRTTLRRRLSGAVLIGGLALSLAGPAAAASAAPSTTPATGASNTAATPSANQHAKASRAIVHALSTADTTDEIIRALNENGTNPKLTSQLSSLLKTLPQDAPKALREADHPVGGILPSDLVLGVLQRSVSGEAATCDANTALNKWANTLLPLAPEGTEDGENQRGALATLVLMGVLNAPTYQAVYEGPSNKTLTRFGEEQDKTSLIKKAFKDVKAWWEVDTGTVTASAMKDDLVTKRSKKALVELAKYSYIGSSLTGGQFDPRHPEEFAPWADYRDEFVKAFPAIMDFVPQLEDGENAIFTTNAFAFMPNDTGVLSGLPKRFIFGDGMLTFLRVAKYGDTGIKTVIGHEYGHHLQFELGTTYPESTKAERSRHSELEADYFANYYVAHKEGLHYTKAQRQLSIDLGYAIGDCEFSSDTHHGTPAQRKAAAVAGQALADTQKKSGRVFAAESVRLKYNAALPGIVASK